MASLRREVWYQGHVQGVGFRYTAARLARQVPVTGYVRNLPDGRVHLVCEGAEEDVRQLLLEIAEQLQSFIRHAQEDSRPATGEFTRFEIRH